MTSSKGGGAGKAGPVEIMSEALSVADVLDRAADLIEPEGAWTQGAYAVGDVDIAEDDDHEWPVGANCFCLMGAVAWVEELAKPGDFDTVKYGRLLGTSIASWNDEMGRTQAEVVAKLREAAAKAREQSA